METINGITYTYEVEYEQIPYEGNAMASGDDEADRAQEQWIRDELNAGNIAAWCSFVVRARRESDGAEGWAALGCCSYTSVDDLLANEYETQKVEALAHLESEYGADAPTEDRDTNATIAMLIKECDALPKTAKQLATRPRYTLEGRSILGADGHEVAYIKAPEYRKGGLGPHGTDVLAKLIVRLLNTHARHEAK